MTLIRVISLDFNIATMPGTVLGADERTNSILDNSYPFSLPPAAVVTDNLVASVDKRNSHSNTQHLLILIDDMGP